MLGKVSFLLSTLAIVLVACAPGQGAALVDTAALSREHPTIEPAVIESSVETEASGAGIENIVPTDGLRLLEEELKPWIADLAMRDFRTDFARHTVPHDELVGGGPPKDGIPPINNPLFLTVAEADDWLAPHEPVILFELEGDARAYPIHVLLWHEMVNDVVGGVPVLITYCPLCNSAVAFRRVFQGQELTFSTTGRLRYSNLIMYDVQTESWWQQATGEGIVGQYAGHQLTFVPASVISWADFRAHYPHGMVLAGEIGISEPFYGLNLYEGYDRVDGRPYHYRDPPSMEPCRPWPVSPPSTRLVSLWLTRMRSWRRCTWSTIRWATNRSW